MSSGKVGLKRYMIPITFDIFKPMWSMCLLHLDLKILLAQES